MQRRDVLRGAAGAAALPLVSTAAAANSTADSTQESYAPLGSVAIEGARENVVGADGETAFVATGNGFAAVDVADPASPEVLSEVTFPMSDRENGPLSGIKDVKVDGDTLIAVGPANPRQEGEVLRGMLVYDVSDPAAPERTAFHETEYAVHNSYLKDGVAYLTALHQDAAYGDEPARTPVVMVDVSGDQPSELARWSIVDHDEGWLDVHWYPRTNHDLYVHGDTLYMAHWDAGTWLVDVSDPQNPEYVNHFGEYSLEELQELSRQEMFAEGTEAPGNSHYVAVNDDASLLASGAESWDVPSTDEIGAPGGIDLWDITDPQNPEKLAFIEGPPTPDPTRAGTWTTSHNFDFHGDRLYTSWYRGGVKIHDVSDPANPEELAWWRHPDQTMFWGTQYLNENAFVATSMKGGDEYSAGLYTFPNRAGEQANPPAMVPENGTTTTTEAPQTTTATAEPTTTEATESTTTSDPGESNGSSPGFGLLAGVTAAAGAALAALRRRD